VQGSFSKPKLQPNELKIIDLECCDLRMNVFMTTGYVRAPQSSLLLLATAVFVFVSIAAVEN
jgi:hypothetical protein